MLLKLNVVPALPASVMKGARNPVPAVPRSASHCVGVHLAPILGFQVLLFGAL